MAKAAVLWAAGLQAWAAAATAIALPARTVQLDLTRILDQTAYAVEMNIGTPPQKMLVEVDTGSPFLGLAGTHSNWCELPKKPCAQYGSYDNLTSSTAKYISDEFNNALVNEGFGDYINDTVRVGGQTFPDLQFGMILDYAASFPPPNTIPGLVGLVPFCYDKSTCATPAYTLEQQLLQKGYIRRHSLGLYLGPDEPTATGQVLFGAMDRAKQLGTPVSFPVIPPSEPIANSSPNLANFSSVSVQRKTGSSGTSTTDFKISKYSYGILDSGNPNWSLPTPVWDFVQSYFHLDKLAADSNYYAVDCKFRNPQPDYATLIVGFADDKLKIQIPMERLVTQLASGKCGTAVAPCGSAGEGCAFGDPFLRSTYTYFDFEAFTVTMSNVRYTNQTSIMMF